MAAMRGRGWTTGPGQPPHTFTMRFRGYDPVEVEHFVAETGGRMRRLQERVDELEDWLERSDQDAVNARFRAARSEHDHLQAEARAERAEATQRELRHTLDLAQRAKRQLEHQLADRERSTRRRLARQVELAQRAKRQVVAEAEERATTLHEAAVRRARVEVAAEYRRMFDQADKLDALRLAIAAERVALDEVRADIRSRIGAAAAELNRIADSEYLLGGRRTAPGDPPGEPSPDMVRALRDLVADRGRQARPTASTSPRP